MDFSCCGYAGAAPRHSQRPHPRSRARRRAATPGERIQAALDYVASLPPDPNGLRGAVLLGKGRYEVSGQLLIRGSGVVLRGSGMGAGRHGAGRHGAGPPDADPHRRCRSDRKESKTASHDHGPYVPVGATKFSLDYTEGLKVGDAILIRRPCTPGVDRLPGHRQEPLGRLAADLEAATRGTSSGTARSRRSTATRVTVNAPITTAMESRFGGGTVTAYTWPGRVTQVGVENLRCESTFDAGNPKDENHSWYAITMDNAADAWVRQVAFVHFAGGAVAVWGELQAGDGAGLPLAGAGQRDRRLPAAHLLHDGPADAVPAVL